MQAWTVTGTGYDRGRHPCSPVRQDRDHVHRGHHEPAQERRRAAVPVPGRIQDPGRHHVLGQLQPVDAAVPGDEVAIELADYRTGNEFRLGGTASIVGATITVLRSNAAGTAPTTTVVGTAPVTAVAPPEVGGEWELRIAPPPANPGKVFIRSSQGGVAGPFDVTVR